MTKKEQIKQKLVEFLKNYPEGVNYSKIIEYLSEEFPNFPSGTLRGSLRSIWLEGNVIEKVDRGVFKLKNNQPLHKQIQEQRTNVKEEEFYKPFADWLENDVEECTKAIPLGKNYFKDKWGTPDVIGIRESKRSDIIQFPTEVISAEIKTNTSQLITSFGQACSYKLFSHKVYLVIPKTSPDADLNRIDSLCLIFGIGLVLFDVDNPKSPNFEIRVRAVKTEPDVFYVNKYLKIIEEKLFK